MVDQYLRAIMSESSDFDSPPIWTSSEDHIGSMSLLVSYCKVYLLWRVIVSESALVVTDGVSNDGIMKEFVTK